MSIWNFLAVGTGGALGAIARYATHRSLTALHGSEAALSTLVVNGLGSLGLGLAAGFLVDRNTPAALFVMVGVLGAFTTFSTFAMDAVTLFRDRGAGAALLYVIFSVSISLIAFICGLAMAKGVSF